MSKKKDPIAAVIQYLSTADIFAIEQALTVVKEIVRSRLSPPRLGNQHKKPTAAPRRAVDASPVVSDGPPRILGA